MSNLPDERRAEAAERLCSAICEGDAPLPMPDSPNPRHHIAACYEHQRAADALAPMLAGWRREDEQRALAEAADNLDAAASGGTAFNAAARHVRTFARKYRQEKADD